MATSVLKLTLMGIGGIVVQLESLSAVSGESRQNWFVHTD
jgi:hypothetical protein